MPERPLPSGSATCAQCGKPLDLNRRERFATYCDTGCSTLAAVEAIARAHARTMEKAA